MERHDPAARDRRADHTPGSLLGPVTDRLRRLPWPSATGRPAFLSSKDPDSLLSRAADSTESAMLDSAEDVARCACMLLHDAAPPTREELRTTATRLIESVRDAAHVARLRGERLGMDEPGAEGAP